MRQHSLTLGTLAHSSTSNFLYPYLQFIIEIFPFFVYFIVRHQKEGSMGKNYKALLFTGKGISAPYILEDCKQGLIKNGCEVMELPASSRDADVKTFLTNMKPDFVLSLDHAGINDELFDELEIPCFSWFVDNPFYFIDETHESPSSFFLVSFSDKCSGPVSFAEINGIFTSVVRTLDSSHFAFSATSISL